MKEDSETVTQGWIEQRDERQSLHNAAYDALVSQIYGGSDESAIDTKSRC